MGGKKEWMYEECLLDTSEIMSPHPSKINVWPWWLVKLGSWEQNSSLLTSSSFHHLEHYIPHFLSSLQLRIIMANNWTSKMRSYRKSQMQGRKWIGIGRQLEKWLWRLSLEDKCLGQNRIPSNSVYAPKDCGFCRAVNIQPQCPNRTNIWIVSAKPRLKTATISSEVKNSEQWICPLSTKQYLGIYNFKCLC